jgi:hypothetical protein
MMIKPSCALTLLNWPAHAPVGSSCLSDQREHHTVLLVLIPKNIVQKNVGEKPLNGSLFFVRI